MKRLESQPIVTLFILLFALSLISGCAATSVSLAKKDLDVQTKMSDTIFLDPVSPDKKTIYIQVRNTSDKQNFDIETSIKSAIEAKGYKVIQDPDAAHFHLLANVLSVAKASPTAAESALNNGYGGEVVAGAVAGGLATESYKGAAVGGILAAGVSVVANSLVKDVTFMAVTDIQLAEKAKAGVIVRQDNRQDIKQGIGGGSRQVSSEVSDRKKFRTRIVSTANKVNLEYAEAAPQLTAGLTRSITGLF